MNWKSPLRENFESLIYPLILVLITRTFIFQAFKIPSESMRDTLLIGDHILVNKSIFFDPIPGLGLSLFPIRDPKREDILVFKFPQDPEKDYIKRLIGMGGETVTFSRPNILINGNKLDDSRYAVYRPKYFTPRDGDWPVPSGQYFMMGDNRDNSEDSRFWGSLERNLIRGKAFLIYFSWDSAQVEQDVQEAGPWLGRLLSPWYFIKSIRFSRAFHLLH